MLLALRAALRCVVRTVRFLPAVVKTLLPSRLLRIVEILPVVMDIAPPLITLMISKSAFPVTATTLLESNIILITPIHSAITVVLPL